MLGLSDREFESTMIKMLRTLLCEVDNMQDQMDNVNRKMEALGKNWKEMPVVKNTRIEKNIFDRLISRLDMAEEKLWARRCISRILKKLKAKRTKTGKNKTELPGTMRPL